MVFTIAAQYTLGSSESGTNDKYVVQNKKSARSFHKDERSKQLVNKKTKKNVVYVRNLKYK